jgi:hypothetical protein
MYRTDQTGVHYSSMMRPENMFFCSLDLRSYPASVIDSALGVFLSVGEMTTCDSGQI